MGIVLVTCKGEISLFWPSRLARYSYPRYSWARYGSSQTGFHYCVADPINLPWEKSSGDLYPYTVHTTFIGHGWDYASGNPNYVYDPIYGWRPDAYSLRKEHPTYYRYHVRLWKVHKGGYGRGVRRLLGLGLRRAGLPAQRRGEPRGPRALQRRLGAEVALPLGLTPAPRPFFGMPVGWPTCPKSGDRAACPRPGP
ncbi:MAG: hypothetical protein QI223_01460 [Candidatus Korarchaeota archaeon]|nr:hypothetical protein [Candidatus Korarchaeota archaeon]